MSIKSKLPPIRKAVIPHLPKKKKTRKVSAEEENEYYMQALYYMAFAS